METKEIENTQVQNLWDTAKAVLRGKCIAIQASLKRIEKSKMQSLYSHLKQLEMEQKNRPKPHKKKQLRLEQKSMNQKPEIQQSRSTKLEAGSLKELIRSMNNWPDLSKRKEKGPKLIKL